MKGRKTQSLCEEDITKGTKDADAIFPGARTKLLKIPVFILVPLVYVAIGRLINLWHPTWIMFLFIPIYYRLCIAVGVKTKKSFLLNLPVAEIIVTAYITLGVLFSLWSSAWLMFFLVPIYYWVAAFSGNDSKEK